MIPGSLEGDREWIAELEVAHGDSLPRSIVDLARRRLDDVERLGRELETLLASCRPALTLWDRRETIDYDQGEVDEIRAAVARAEGREADRPEGMET